MEVDDRVSSIIEAYFYRPRSRYAEIVAQIKTKGGLTAREVRLLKDRLIFIHSDTIIRQAGLLEPVEMHGATP
jgi:hypothetical protein